MPDFVMKMSPGNLLQIAGMLVAVTLMIGFTQYQSAANASDANVVREVVSDLDKRVHSIEIRESAANVMVGRIQEDINDIKNIQKSNNDLLRQLIQQFQSGARTP